MRLSKPITLNAIRRGDVAEVLALHDVGPSDIAQLEQLSTGDLVTILKRDLVAFVRVGQVLLVIRNQKRYKDTHGTFEEFCRDLFGMSKTHANRLIKGAETVELLTPRGVIPVSEKQVRPLTALGPENQVAAWNLALEKSNGTQPTASVVEEAVQEIEASLATEPVEKSVDDSFSESIFLAYCTNQLSRLAGQWPEDRPIDPFIERLRGYLAHLQERRGARVA